MQLLTIEILVFMITILDGVRSKLDSYGSNICWTQETYEERTPVSKLKPREVEKKEWCWNVRNLFSCKKTIIVWETHVEYVTVPRTKTVPKCCAGYKEREGKCVPHCKVGCLFGNCEAPDLCVCLAGFHGPGCYKPCDTGFWGENCINECKCSNYGVCDKRFGCQCSLGWTGLRCESPCLDGFYGYLCKQECKCDGASCNHITGECMTSTEPTTTAYISTTETETLSPFITTERDEFSTEEFHTQTFSTTYFKTSTEVQVSTENSTITEISTTEIFKLPSPVNPDSTIVNQISTIEETATTTEETDATISLKETDFSEGDAFANSGETVSAKPPLNFTKGGTFVGELTTVRISSEESETDIKINVVEEELHFDGDVGSSNKPEKVTTVSSISFSETVNESDIIKKETSWIGLTASNDDRDKDVTDNFILETNGNSKSKETILKFLHFLPSFSVISAVSFLILIIAARWLIVTHRRKTRMLVVVAEKGNIFQSEEPVKFQAENLFWVNNCTVNPVYMSDVDLNNATPVLETFKPVDKVLTSQERTIL